MIRRSMVFATMAAFAIAACEDDTTSVERDGVAVTPRDNGVVLENNRDRTIYYFLADQAELALIDWLPCKDPDTCAGVESDESATVPEAQIIGWGSSAVLVVFWWELDRQANGEYEIEEFHSVRVDY